MGTLRILPDIKIFRQDVVGLCPVRVGLPSLVRCLFLPELQLCRETADAQTGKSIVREQDLPQKAEPALHLPDLPLVSKIICQKRLGHDQRKDSQRLQYLCRFQAVVHLGGYLPAVFGPPL